MTRLFAILAIMGLVILGSPAPASAAPVQSCEAVPALSITLPVEVCVSVSEDAANAFVTLGGGTLAIVDLPIVPIIETVIETVTETVTVEVPGPTTTVTAPAPTPGSPSTVTRTPATVTRAPTTVTATETAEATVTESQTTTETATPTGSTATVTRAPTPPTGQRTTSSDTVTLDLPGSQDTEGAGPIPDDPEQAAAAGSIFGLIVGLLLGLLGLFIAYRRGQIDGEKATLSEFLGVIRGEPVGPKHRA